MFCNYGVSVGQTSDVKSVPAEQQRTVLYVLDSTYHSNIQGEKVDLFAWHPQYLERCYSNRIESDQNKNIETIKELLIFLNKDSVFAKYFSDILRKLNPALCIDNRADETRVYYDFKYNVIALREQLDLLEKLVIFVHEIRHVDNILTGSYCSLDNAREEVVRMTFAMVV